jgi:hypothetical protein
VQLQRQQAAHLSAGCQRRQGHDPSESE